MGVVNVDDRSPQAVFNPGGWTLGGSQQEFGGTTHGTNMAGSTATFRFTGTSVTVFGSVSASFKSIGPVSTYSLDGGAPVTFAPNPPADDIYRVVFYSSGQLSSGEHTLLIRSGRAGAQLWLDYFSYTTDDGSTSSPSPQPPVSTQQKPSPNPTNTSAGQTTGTTTVTTAPPNQTSPASNGSTVPNQTFTSLVTAGGNNPTAVYSLSISTASNPPSSTSAGADPMASSSTGGSSMSTGPMVGIALGAVALVIAVLLLLWVLIRRRRKRTMAASSLYTVDGTSPLAGQIEAFPSTQATYSSSDTPAAFHKHGGPVQATQAASANSNSSDAGTSNVDNVLAAKYGAREGQQVLVVYEPYPTEAPPDYRLRQSTV